MLDVAFLIAVMFNLTFVVAGYLLELAPRRHVCAIRPRLIKEPPAFAAFAA